MKAEQIYENNIVEKILNSILNKQEGLFYFVADETIAFPGYGNPINKDICDANNIKVISLPNEGGIIVSGPGSISIGHFSKDLGNTFNKDLTNCLISWLQDLNLNVTLYGNDILIDNTYKVASSGTRNFDGILFSTFHISYSVDIDLIKQICTKPMIKIPKGLEEFGISQKQLEQVLWGYYDRV